MNIDDLGDIIRRRRKELGVQQQRLSELADVSVHTVSNIESGAGNPTLASLTSVLDVLGLELTIQAKAAPGN